MELVIKFPRRGVDPNLQGINDFLKDTDLSSKGGRKFGVYRRMFGVEGKKSKKCYILQFKFFENARKEIKDLRIEINQGSFNTKEAKKNSKLRKMESDICFLSYLSSLDLQSVELSVDGDLLSVKVELDDSYQYTIYKYRELISPKL